MGGREEEEWVTITWDHRNTFSSTSPRPPLSERSLDFPGVNPADVAADCNSRADYGCVLRASERIESHTYMTRSRMMRAMVELERYDELAEAMAQVPREEVVRYSGFQGILWRLEHDLPAGGVNGPAGMF